MPCFFTRVTNVQTNQFPDKVTTDKQWYIFQNLFVSRFETDSAAEEATFLTKFSNVTLIHRRDKLRASKVMQKKVLENPEIVGLCNTVIKELVGNGKLKAIVCEDVKTKQKTVMAVDGLFYRSK